MTGPDASPRTASEPMAFTTSEFVRGALSAWWMFLVVLTAVHIWLGPIAFIVAWYAAPWSIGALVAGAPLAWALGRMLRRDPDVRVHFAAFLALGLVVGGTTTWLAIAAGVGGGATGLAFYAALHVVAAAIAVPLGWWRVARTALRSDGATVEAAPSTAPPAADGAR